MHGRLIVNRLMREFRAKPAALRNFRLEVISILRALEFEPSLIYTMVRYRVDFEKSFYVNMVSCGQTAFPFTSECL